MTTERVPCLMPDCRNTILPATAKANDGLCAPCLGKKRQAEREEYIRKNRRTVDLYAGVTDPVELICIMLTPRPLDPLVVYTLEPQSLEALFSKLSPDQIQHLASLSGKAIKEGSERFGEELGKSLAVFTNANLDDMLADWLDMENYWPSIVFRNAGPHIRDRIIDAINSGNANVSHALCALAWIGDQVVQEQFTAWEASPEPWRKQLYVGPATYAQIGGWELTNNGRRNLYYDNCLALVATDKETSQSNVQLITDMQEACPWCKNALVHLISIPTSDPKFQFLGYYGETLSVLTCERCTCFGEHLFARINSVGKPEWHPANQQPSYIGDLNSEWGHGPWKGLSVKLQARPAIFAADWGMEIPATQIGGMPTWVQDSAYPTCPDCSKKMKFLAQLDNNQFKNCEGIYYAFWCADCRNTATTYQQT
jgi:hypothetical protein